MKDSLQFWQDVTSYIEKEFGQGDPPSQWKQGQIEEFLIHLEEEIITKCKKEPSLARILKLPTKDGRVNYSTLSVPSYDTFLRIFKNNESQGNNFTKNLFAIYLGYKSFNDFFNKRYPSRKNTQPNSLKTEMKFIKDEAFSYGSSWLLRFVIICSIILNLIGIYKSGLTLTYFGYLFWIPILLIGVLYQKLFNLILQKSPTNSELLPLVWWSFVVIQLIFNFFFTGCINVIEIVVFSMIGIIGQLSFITELIILSNNQLNTNYKKSFFSDFYSFDLNIATLTFIIGIFGGLLILGAVWIIPEESFFYHTKTVLDYRWICSIDIVVGIFLISSSFIKLLFNPILVLRNNHHH